MEFIREKYWEYEYDEVITPNVYNFDLWKTSVTTHYRRTCSRSTWRRRSLA